MFANERADRERVVLLERPAYGLHGELGHPPSRLAGGSEFVFRRAGRLLPRPLCTRAEFISKVTEALPSVGFTDPSWGRVQGPDFSVQLNVGGIETIDAVMLHVRGGDGALAVVKCIADALSARAIDCSEGEFLDFSTPEAEASFQPWRTYRDRAVDAGSENG